MRLPATDRLMSGAAALAIEAGLVAMLLFGLAVGISKPVDDTLKTFSVAPLPESLKRSAPEPHRVAPRRSGRAAPPNLKARPTEIVQPPLQIPIPIPPPVVAAPVAADGAASRAGAAPLAGPGTGAGGRGHGLGAGGAGDGNGGGGGDTAPRQIKGRIRDQDYPRDLWSAGIGGTVSVRYHVEIDGRATGCGVTASSGNITLDATTCRLIEQRFRFTPALDETGRPVRSTIVEDHDWVIDDRELANPHRAARAELDQTESVLRRKPEPWGGAWPTANAPAFAGARLSKADRVRV